MRFLYAAISCMLFAPFSVALAQSEPAPLTSMTVSIWATPREPGVHLDVFDPLIAENVDTILVFIVAEAAESLTPAQFDEVHTQFANGAGLTNAATPDAVPSLLTDSVGYLQADEGATTYFLVAYEANLVFFLGSISALSHAEQEATLNRIARDYLTSFRESPPPALTQAILEGFVGDDENTIERPLSRLPSQTDIPTEFQFLDEEYVVITNESLHTSSLVPRDAQNIAFG